MEKRNLFQKIFGGKVNTGAGYKAYELISTSNNTFSPWNGKIFDNDIVRSALRPKANAIGKLNPKHVRGSGEKMKINPDPYINALMKRPNPFMSMQDFLMKMTFQRELNHNAFAYIQRDNTGYPTALYPIPYSMCELLDRGGELFLRFQFWTGKQMAVPYTDVIHLRKDFVEHDFFGEKGTKALESVMNVISYTDQSVVAAVKNSAVIKWIMKFKNVLQPKDVEAQIKEFTKNYLSISNEGGAAASDPRYELEQVKDNSFVPNAAQMKEATQRLYSYFGVNDSIVQNKFDEDQWNAFYESELEPIILQLSSAFTQAFFTAREQLGNRIVFESSSLQYASMKTKLELREMVDRGAMTPNEWREVLNMGPVEGGDDPIRRLDTAVVEDNKVKEGENVEPANKDG